MWLQALREKPIQGVNWIFNGEINKSLSYNFSNINNIQIKESVRYLLNEQRPMQCGHAGDTYKCNQSPSGFQYSFKKIKK